MVYKGPYPLSLAVRAQVNIEPGTELSMALTLELQHVIQWAI